LVIPRPIRAHFKNPFITPTPADITSYVTFNETFILEFVNPHLKSGYAVIQFIKTLTNDELMKKIPVSGGKLFLNKEMENDIEEVNFSVNMRCPLSFCRINIPGKGIHCEHVQCIDLPSYLSYSQQQQVWHCPVCSHQLPFQDLVVDTFFQKILNAIPDDCLQVVVHSDGTWDYQISPPAKKVKYNTPTQSQIEFEDCEMDQDLRSLIAQTFPVIYQNPLQIRVRKVTGNSSKTAILIDSDDD